jgi:hypothetical protein
MHKVAVQLELWRAAERQRDSSSPNSPEWLAADEEIRHARTIYRAEVAQETAYYAELDLAAHEPRFVLWPHADRQTSRNR